MLTVLDSSELLGNAICGGLQRPTVYESLSGSCLGCFRRKQIMNFEPAARCKVVRNFNPFWSLVPADWLSKSKVLEAKEL